MIEEAESPLHGTALTERVIEVVRRDPGASALPYMDVPWIEGAVARPIAEDALARAAFAWYEVWRPWISPARSVRGGRGLRC